MEESEAHKSQPHKAWWKYLLSWTLIVLGILLVIVVGVNLYLQSGSTKTFNNIGGLNGGAISFKESNISWWSDFPQVTVELKTVQISDSSLREDRNPILKVEELEAAVSFLKWREDTLVIEELRIKDGLLFSHTEEDGYNNIGHLLDAQGGGKQVQLAEEGIVYSLENLAYKFTNARSGKDISGNAYRAEGNLKHSAQGIQTLVDLDLGMEAMIFKAENGAFLKNSHIKGNFDLILRDGRALLSPTLTQINDRNYTLGLDLDLDQEELSELTLVSERTQMDILLPLLADNLRNTLSGYNVDREFYSSTRIRGTFQDGDDPEVSVDLLVEESQIRLKDKVFENASFQAQVYNRLEPGSHKAEDPRNLRIRLDNLEAQFQDFTIHEAVGDITSTPQTMEVLDIQARVSGPASAISDILANDQFFFRSGNIDMSADIRGPLNDILSIMEQSNALVEISQPMIYYAPSEAEIPLDRLRIDKQSNQGYFTINGRTKVKEDAYVINGKVEDILALMRDIPGRKPQTDLRLNARHIYWPELIALVGAESSEAATDETELVTSVKATARGIYENFRPRLEIDIDSLEYRQGVHLNDFHSRLSFSESSTLKLDSTYFTTDGSSLLLTGDIDISDDTLTFFNYALEGRELDLATTLPKLDYFDIDLLKGFSTFPERLDVDVNHRGVLYPNSDLVENSSVARILLESSTAPAFQGEISLDIEDSTDSSAYSKQLQFSGSPEAIHTYLNNSSYFFHNGAFDAQLQFSGNPKSLLELIDRSEIVFNLDSTEVEYRPAELRLPIQSLDLTMDQDQASYGLDIGSASLETQVKITGDAEHFSEIILGNTGRDFSTSALIEADVLDRESISNLVSKFDSEAGEALNERPSPGQVVRSLEGLMNKFDPELQVRLGRFVYSPSLTIRDVEADIIQSPDHELLIEHAKLRMNEARIALDASLGLDTEQAIPFSIDFRSDSLELEAFLRSMDYFGMDELAQAKTFEGLLDLHLIFSAAIAADSVYIVPSTREGRLMVNLDKGKIEGFAPLDSLTAKLKNPQRYAQILLAPISSEIKIYGEQISIPLCEIQSNAILLYVEGELSQDPADDLWISIPIRDLKRKSYTTIPCKPGYGAAGAKVHAQFSKNQSGVYERKIRSSKRRFYKSRGLLDRYREDKKKWKEEKRKGRKPNCVIPS